MFQNILLILLSKKMKQHKFKIILVSTLPDNSVFRYNKFWWRKIDNNKALSMSDDNETNKLYLNKNLLVATFSEL